MSADGLPLFCGDAPQPEFEGRDEVGSGVMRNERETHNSSGDARAISFLSYAGRSGSTLLARRLAAAHPAVVVVPETRPLEILLSSGPIDAADLEVADVLKALADDSQLGQYTNASWSEISSQTIRHAQQDGWPGVAQLFASYATGLDLQTRVKHSALVFKMGSIVFSWREVSQRIPGATVFYVHRHPCAVANSQLTTLRAYHPGEDMGRSDPWHCAVSWRRNVEAALRLGPEANMLRFDQVLDGTAVSRVLDVLDVAADAEEFDWPAQVFEVADAERSLHLLVADKPSVERTNAWQDELPESAQSIVAALTSSAATELGYELPPAAEGRELAAARVRHYWSFASYALRRLARFWRDPRRILLHLRLRSRSLRRARRSN